MIEDLVTRQRDVAVDRHDWGELRWLVSGKNDCRCSLAGVLVGVFWLVK